GGGQKDSVGIAGAGGGGGGVRGGLGAEGGGVGDIDVSRDFLDVQDVLSAYLRLLSHGEAGAVYNVCSGQEQKIRELIELLADIAQGELEIVQDPARMRRAEQRRVRGSQARLHRTTGGEVCLLYISPPPRPRA
ncbi:NAD-dependent epimerase/dehydratase family protein, partial [Pseudomonas aeruginosa]|uniref:NAD-dependent epimerase/dehydratase family protein n=1 Tax=Pseudomonas aeruginosa TaxID=287 RepID=UPI003F80C7DA